MEQSELRAVIEAHQSMVFSIALRMVRDRGVAEEVAQDVFLELYRSADGPVEAEHQRNWLRRVAVHRSTDAIRRRRRQPEITAESWTEGMQDGWPERAGGVDEGTAQRLEWMVGSLPEAMRVAVVLRYGEEMTPGEIGVMLQQPVATVKSTLQRALKMLRQKATVTMRGYVRER